MELHVQRAGLHATLFGIVLALSSTGCERNDPRDRRAEYRLAEGSPLQHASYVRDLAVHSGQVFTGVKGFVYRVDGSDLVLEREGDTSTDARFLSDGSELWLLQASHGGGGMFRRTEQGWQEVTIPVPAMEVIDALPGVEPWLVSRAQLFQRTGDEWETVALDADAAPFSCLARVGSQVWVCRGDYRGDGTFAGNPSVYRYEGPGQWARFELPESRGLMNVGDELFWEDRHHVIRAVEDSDTIIPTPPPLDPHGDEHARTAIYAPAHEGGLLWIRTYSYAGGIGSVGGGEGLRSVVDRLQHGTWVPAARWEGDTMHVVEWPADTFLVSDGSEIVRYDPAGASAE